MKRGEKVSTFQYTVEVLKYLVRHDYKMAAMFVNEHKYKFLIYLCLIKLILQVFSITTIATFACLLYATYHLMLQKKEEILEKGLAHYMPVGIKNALLNRSLLDILCDMWFIPTLSIYLKTIMAPMFSSKRRGPEDAVKYLDPLDPKHRNVFITKGLAFLFPKKIARILLPREHFQTAIMTHSIKNDSFLSDCEESDGGESTQIAINQNSEPEKIIQLEPEKMLPAEPGSPLLAPITVPVVESTRRIDRSQATSPDHLKKAVAVFKMHDPISSPVRRSKILVSSQMMRLMKNMPGRIDPSWDNMQEYKKRQHAAIPRSHSSDKLNILQLMIDIKRMQFLKHVSKKTAYKISGGAAVILLVQLYFFKKARNWTKNLLLLATFMGGLGVLAAGAAYLVLHHKFTRNEKEDRKSQSDWFLALKAREQEREAEESSEMSSPEQ